MLQLQISAVTKPAGWMQDSGHLIRNQVAACIQSLGSPIMGSCKSYRDIGQIKMLWAYSSIAYFAKAWLCKGYEDKLQSKRLNSTNGQQHYSRCAKIFTTKAVPNTHTLPRFLGNHEPSNFVNIGGLGSLGGNCLHARIHKCLWSLPQFKNVTLVDKLVPIINPLSPVRPKIRESHI
jgi:hypothetical protein